MSAIMLAIVISRQMTIGPKKLSRAKDYHKLQNRPTILSSSREENTLRKWPRVDRLRGDTCPYVCPQTGLN